MKKVIALLLALAMVFSFAACASETASDASSDTASSNSETSKPDTSASSEKTEDITLRLWTFLDVEAKSNGRAVVLAQLIENFEATHPGVTLKVETQEWTTLASKIFAAHETGEAPDLFMVNTANLGEAISRGVYEPLENLFYNDWTDEQKADICSTVFEQSFDGTYHYEIPMFYGCFGVMYRKDLFAEKNIDPSSIVTWDDLIEAAKTLTYVDDNGNQIYGYGIGYSLEVTDSHGILPATLFGQDGGMFTDDGMPNNWTGESAQKALQLELDMVNTHAVTPASAAAISSEDVYTDFQAGNYAMIAGGSVRMPTVQGACSFDPESVGFLAVPGIDANTIGLSYAAGWNMGVWSGSEHKDVAGDFLEYICSAEADELWVKTAQQIPLLQSTLENCSDFFAEPTNSWIITAKDILTNRAYVQSINYTTNGFNEDLQNAFQLAYVEGYSVPDALARVEQNYIDRNSGR